MTDQKQSSFDALDRKEKVNLDQSFTKFQKAMLMTISFGMMMFCMVVIVFGSNDMGTSPSLGEQEMLEQIRNEKLVYIDSRTVSEQGNELRAKLTIDVLAQIKEEVTRSKDPSSIDIEARVNELTDF